MPPRSSPRLSQSPLALTSDGQLVVGLGYTADLRDLDGAIRLLRSRRVRGEVFVGVVLSGRARARAIQGLDDAAAEIAGTSRVILAGKGGQR